MSLAGNCGSLMEFGNSAGDSEKSGKFRVSFCISSMMFKKRFIALYTKVPCTPMSLFRCMLRGEKREMVPSAVE